jgi:hypothetical protein
MIGCLVGFARNGCYYCFGLVFSLISFRFCWILGIFMRVWTWNWLGQSSFCSSVFFFNNYLHLSLERHEEFIWFLSQCFFFISWNISQNSNCLNLGGLFSCSVVWGFSGVNRYVFWFHFQMLLMLCFVCVCLAVECAWDLLVAAVLRLARVFVLAMFVVYALQVSLALLNSCLFFFS